MDVSRKKRAVSQDGSVFVKAASLGDRLGHGMKAALIGGTASAITGGKFANGAVTAAFSRLLNDDAALAKEAAQKTPIERAKEKLTNQPLSGSKLTKANPAVGQGCGGYHCRTGGKHDGVDILATDGAKLNSPGDGTASVGYLKGYGKTVLIDHGDGVQTRFAHLSSYSVSEGAKVTVSTVIGAVGTTGNVPAGGQTHLHFEVIVDGNRINPNDIFTWEQDK